MKRKLNEMWKIKEGSKILWVVQCPKGRLTFTRKRDAVKWIEATAETPIIKGGK